MSHFLLNDFALYVFFYTHTYRLQRGTKDNFIVANGDDGQIKYALSRHAYNYHHIHRESLTFVGSCVSNTHFFSQHTFQLIMIGLEN